MSYTQTRQSMQCRLAETQSPEIRQRMLRNLAELKQPAPRVIVTEWSQSYTCDGNYLGHEEEPCRPDCTGYSPVRAWSVLGHSEGGPKAASQPGGSYGPTLAGPCYD